MADPTHLPDEIASTGREASSSGPRAVRVTALLVAAGLSGVFLIDLCNVVYACGCRSLWAGAASACNVAAADPPHCPWCVAGWWGLGLPLAAIAGVQTAVLLWPGRASLLARVLLAAAAFPAVGTFVAVAWGMIVGYWR
jgi:hypothetical protein